jgi:ABC-type antimicrobial peptide transport system permease subunit
MKIVDYLLMKSPSKGDGKMGEPSEQISTRRIVLSLIGLILGIFFSFLITGIEKTTGISASTSSDTTQTSTVQAQTTPVQTQTDTVQAQIKNEKSQTEPEKPQAKPGLLLPSLKDLFPLIIISLVICMLSYQGLYASLKLYNNEPTFLVLFVAFQYGFFWESIVKGASTFILHG